jgi:hypothetical protein
MTESSAFDNISSCHQDGKKVEKVETGTIASHAAFSRKINALRRS